MKNKNLNVQQILEKINEHDMELMSLKASLRLVTGSQYIVAALNRSAGDFDMSDADLLVDELLNRDEPLTYGMIDEIFKNSGFKYDRSHVVRSAPDSQETLDREITLHRRWE